MNVDKRIFEGKKTLVIGGSGGIGLELSRKLAGCGADLYIQGRKKKNLEGLSESCFTFLEYDFTAEDFDALENSLVMKTAESADILCVCYGPFLQKPLTDMTFNEWKNIAVLDYALPGIFVSAALKNMVNRKWGRILLFGGTGTEHRSEFLTNAAYAGAKTAVGTLVRSTAFAYADFGITCNAILPGFTKTEYSQSAENELSAKMPLGTMISSRSVAESGMFLLENSDLNGVLLRVDRGWSPLQIKK